MEINIEQKVNTNFNHNQIAIKIEHNSSKQEIRKIINYINHYRNEIIVKKEKELIKIPYEDTIMFYSKGKDNYCKTYENEYKIKSKLYELEKQNQDFIRISKKCIVNFNHVIGFDMSKMGKIMIKLDNKEIAEVSRRRVKDVMDYLDERRI